MSKKMGVALAMMAVAVFVVFIVILCAQAPGFGDWLNSMNLVQSLIEVVTMVAFGLALVAVYFLPAILGRNKRNANAILVLNLLTGWTILGWIIALVWACTVDSEK
jgi:hypothetical protein